MLPTLAPTRQQLATLSTPHPRPAAEQLLDPAAGTVTIGVRADGDPARLPLWTEHGAVHLSISGGTDTPDVLTHIWAAESASPLVSPWAAGFDQDLNNTVGPRLDGRACTPEQTHELLGAVVAEARARYGTAAAWPTTYQPTEAEPLITVTLTMWALTTCDPESVLLVDELARTGRRTGISLRIAHHRHHRDTLGSAVYVAMNQGARIALRGQGSDVDLGEGPAAIPARLRGTGYLLTPGRDLALFRTWAQQYTAA